MKFGVRVCTWDVLPTPNFERMAQGDLSLMDKFTPKICNFHDFQLLKPTFLYHNVKILLKRTDFLIGIHQRQKILSKLLKGPAGIALPRRWCMLISSFISFLPFFTTLWWIIMLIRTKVVGMLEAYDDRDILIDVYITLRLFFRLGRCWLQLREMEPVG